MQETRTTPISLDNIETSVLSIPPYKQVLIDHDPAEYKAAIQTYLSIDTNSPSSRALKMEDCRTRAFFAVHGETRKVKVLANACRCRWCPLCTRAKSAAICNSVMDWLKFRKKAKFLTLTLKHSNAPLTHQINNLYRCFRLLRKSKLFTSKCYGGIWFFQVKLSIDKKNWHPHLHCVIDSKYIPQGELSELWLKITNSSKIVDIRNIYKIEQAAAYVARYSARPSKLKDLSFSQRTEIVFAMHGRRISGSWGTAKNVDLRGNRPIDKGTWYRIASYKTLIQRSRSDELCSLVLSCWSNNLPLPDSYAIENLQSSLNQIDFPGLNNFNIDDFDPP